MDTAMARGMYAREMAAEVLKAWRLPQFMVPTVLTPAAFYALFNVAMQAPPERAAYSLATFGVFAAIGPSVFGFGTGVAVERETGQLELKRVSPMPVGAHLAGKLAASLVFTGLALALIYAIAAVGARVRLPAGAWAPMVAVHLASVFPFALVGLGIGYRLGSKGAVAAANAAFLLFAVAGGLWMPIAAFPPAMQAAAWALPSYHLGELALAAAGVPRPGDMGVHAAVLVAVTAAAGLWAWTGWRRQGV